MRPVLINPPSDPVVALPDLKEHLRVDHSDEDSLIQTLQAGAVAHLDGWAGILGRCIMPQTWALDLGPGKHVLPFPDVTEATLDPDGEAIVIEVQNSDSGPVVNLPKAGRLQFVCAMPDELLPAAQVAVKMWVAEVYKNRETSNAAGGVAFQMLVSSLRWWRV